MTTPHHPPTTWKRALLGALFAAACGASYAIIDADDHRALPTMGGRVSYAISLPTRILDLDAPDDVADAGDGWLDLNVRKGETLAEIFTDFGVNSGALDEVLRVNFVSGQLRNLAPGHNLRIKIAPGGQLDRLVYQQTPAEQIEIHRATDGFVAHKITQRVDRELTRASATIRTSLFQDAHAAGIPDRLILQMASIFEYDIDFAQDLQEGDHFTVIYETLYLNGEPIGTGDILAAEFVNQGKTHRTFRFVDAQGHENYYGANGQSPQKAFLRTPVEFAHISSHFSLARRHPVLNTLRAHKGVDYAAPTGTPIRATGKGRVAFSGVQGGYGNVVILEHGRSYSTLYGHLSRFAPGLRSGAEIQQGQVIGYVGQTGLATGSHLHYEFRVNGEHKNPLTVAAALPQAEPLKGTPLTEFLRQNHLLAGQLDRFHAISLARAD